MAAALQVTGLSCRRGERLLFDNLSFQVDAGEVLQLPGPNGCGKTSLLQILAGLHGPDSGVVYWRGTPTAKETEGYWGSLRWLGHRNGLNLGESPRENLAVAAALSAAPLEDSDRILHRVGLQRYADKPCKRLSAGQRRRAALARLLVGSASLWLLDEPFAALDASGRDLVESLLAEHTLNGGLAVVATHHPLRQMKAKELVW